MFERECLREYVRTPSVSRNGTSCSPETISRFADLKPSATVSTSRRLREPSSSSAVRSTRSATSSPKSPTAASELTFRVEAFCLRRSCFESGTRVNKSSSTRARASMRAISRLANALCTISSSPRPTSSGASPTSRASSYMT